MQLKPNQYIKIKEWEAKIEKHKKMWEYLKFKEICNIIWYDKETLEKYDVRLYIFTTEFMDRFFKFLENTEIYRKQREIIGNRGINTFFRDDIMQHLDDPVSYLYNLLDLWNTN